MKELFIQILNMSIQASYLILAVLIIRLVFKSLPKSARIFLWTLVGIRLICPFTIESIFSLIPSKRVVTITNTIQPDVIINTGNQQVNQTIQQSITNIVEPTISNNPDVILDYTSLISIIWFIGIVIFIAYSIISVIQLKKKVNEAVNIKDNIYLCDHIDSCFVFGLIKPKIYCPSSMNEEDMIYIIAHENTHIKRKDYLLKPIAFLLLSIHWFNPIVWYAYKCFCNDLELACDECVLLELGLENKKEYSNTLISYSDQTHLGVCPLAFSEKNIKERVLSILNYKKPNTLFVGIGVLICSLFIICFMTNPKEIKTTLIKYKPNENLESMTTVDDIEGWDIPLDEVKSVVVKSNIYNGGGTKEVILTKEESMQLIQAFNAVQNKDVLEIHTEALYGAMPNCYVTIETMNGNISIISTEYGYVWYNDICYVLQVQTEYFNLLREFDEKYNIGINAFEYIYLECGHTDMMMGGKNYLVLSSDTKINDARITLGCESLPEYHLTFNELLKPYANKLSINDVIETQDMRIKVIDMVDNDVIAVAIEIFGNEKIEENEQEIEKEQWENHDYSKFIPKPNFGKLSIQKEEVNEFSILVEKTTKTNYEWYVNQCKSYGFDGYQHYENTYDMKDKDSYRLILTYDEEKEELLIQVKEPTYSVPITVRLNNMKSSNKEFTVNIYVNNEKISFYTWYDGDMGDGINIGSFYPKGEYTIKFDFDIDKSNYIETTFEVDGTCEYIYELDCYDDRIEIKNIEKVE